MQRFKYLCKLESRLDVLLYRINYAFTIKEARKALIKRNCLVLNNKKFQCIRKPIILNPFQIFQIKNKKVFSKILFHRLYSKKIIANYPSWIYFSYRLFLGFLLSNPKRFRYGYSHTSSIASFIGTARYF